MPGRGLYANIHAKRKRGGRMRKKVQRVHRQQLTLREQDEQRGKDNDKIMPKR